MWQKLFSGLAAFLHVILAKGHRHPISQSSSISGVIFLQLFLFFFFQCFFFFFFTLAGAFHIINPAVLSIRNKLLVSLVTSYHLETKFRK